MSKKKKTQDEVLDDLRSSREANRKSCPSASPKLQNAIPAVEVKEKPGLLDDNVFHKDEPLTVVVAAKVKEGNSYAKDKMLIVGEPVTIRYADGGKQEVLSDDNGEVQMWNPRAVGDAHIEIPSLHMYSNSIKLTIVE